MENLPHKFFAKIALIAQARNFIAQISAMPLICRAFAVAAPRLDKPMRCPYVRNLEMDRPRRGRQHRPELRSIQSIPHQ
jgi:hypothetical protein